MRLFTFLIITGCLIASGCDVVQYAIPEKQPYYSQLWRVYLDINLKQSTSADVLSTFKTSDYELLSQSTSVIASAGQKRKTLHTWLNMAAFDEDDATVRRKYLLVVNERPKKLFNLFGSKWEGATFDCRMLLDQDVLEEPYANENARRIAILKKVLENTRGDIDQVDADNKIIRICGVIINQALESALQPLDSSPALAARLSENSGLSFEHASFNKGKIQMLIEGDIVTVKMMLGSFIGSFETRKDPRPIELKKKQEQEKRLPLPPKI